MGKRKRKPSKQAQQVAQSVKRSRASKRGWQTRRAKAKATDALASFVLARDTREAVFAVTAPGDPNRGAAVELTNQAHKKWRRAQPKLRSLGQKKWEQILFQIGEALDLDDDYIFALDESPKKGKK